MFQAYKCAECGHLHFLGPDYGYEECPIDGCDCVGQEWARNMRPADEDRAEGRNTITRAADLDLCSY